MPFGRRRIDRERPSSSALLAVTQPGQDTPNAQPAFEHDAGVAPTAQRKTSRKGLQWHLPFVLALPDFLRLSRAPSSSPPRRARRPPRSASPDGQGLLDGPRGASRSCGIRRPGPPIGRGPLLPDNCFRRPRRHVPTRSRPSGSRLGRARRAVPRYLARDSSHSGSAICLHTVRTAEEALLQPPSGRRSHLDRDARSELRGAPLVIPDLLPHALGVGRRQRDHPTGFLMLNMAPGSDPIHRVRERPAGRAGPEMKRMRDLEGTRNNEVARFRELRVDQNVGRERREPACEPGADSYPPKADRRTQGESPRCHDPIPSLDHDRKRRPALALNQLSKPRRRHSGRGHRLASDELVPAAIEQRVSGGVECPSDTKGSGEQIAHRSIQVVRLS